MELLTPDLPLVSAEGIYLHTLAKRAALCNELAGLVRSLNKTLRGKGLQTYSHLPPPPAASENTPNYSLQSYSTERSIEEVSSVHTHNGHLVLSQAA